MANGMRKQTPSGRYRLTRDFETSRKAPCADISRSSLSTSLGCVFFTGANCGPFKVVLINCDLPKKDGVEVAMGILVRNPSQGMIITAFDYASEEDVPRPKELTHIPILIGPRKVELRRSLERLQDRFASASPLS